MIKWQGMTLIEVLVALAIFAIAALSVMRSSTQHITTLGTLEQKMFAHLVADNQMAKIMLGEYPSTSSKQGKSELAGRTWYWEITPVQTESQLLKAVDVKVKEEKKQNHVFASIRSYVK